MNLINKFTLAVKNASVAFFNNSTNKGLIQEELKTKHLLGELAPNTAFFKCTDTIDYGIYGYPTRGEVLQLEGMAEAERIFRDPQVRACFNTLIFSILQKDFNIVAAGNSRKSVELKAFIDYCLSQIQGNIQDVFYELMASGIHYGYAFSEKVFKYAESGKFEGKLIWKAIKNKRPGLNSFKMDDFDNITGIENLISFGNKETLPVEKFVIFTFLKLFGSPYGQDLFSSLHKFVYSKNHLIQQMLIANAKFASETVGVKIPKSDIDDPESVAYAQSMAEAVQGGNALAYPDGLEITLWGGQRAGTCPYIPRIQMLDSQIALTILGNDLTTTQSQGGGTHAETKQKFKVTSIYSGYLQKYIEEVFNEQLLKDIISWNFDPVAYPVDIYPTCGFSETIEEDQKEVAETLKIHIDNEVLRPQERVNDEIYYREKAKLPPLSKEEIKARLKLELEALKAGGLEKEKDGESDQEEEDTPELFAYNYD